MTLSHSQYKRTIELTNAGLNRRDSETLVGMWDSLSLEQRLEMFELAGNEEEAALVRAAINREAAA